MGAVGVMPPSGPDEEDEDDGGGPAGNESVKGRSIGCGGRASVISG